MSIDSSKIYEWLLENDCPWDWVPINDWDNNIVTIEFTDKDKEL